MAAKRADTRRVQGGWWYQHSGRRGRPRLGAAARDTTLVGCARLPDCPAGWSEIEVRPTAPAAPGLHRSRCAIPRLDTSRPPPPAGSPRPRYVLYKPRMILYPGPQLLAASARRRQQKAARPNHSTRGGGSVGGGFSRSRWPLSPCGAGRVGVARAPRMAPPH